MALTPLDIIMKHLGDEREHVEAGNPPTDTISVAIAINEELKQNFRILAPAAPWETDAEALAAEQRRVAPDPVVPPSDVIEATDITLRASGNPMLWYVGTDQRGYRLDDGLLPGSMGFPSGREAQIALALTDLSASRLHDVTK